MPSELDLMVVPSANDTWGDQHGIRSFFGTVGEAEDAATALTSGTLIFGIEPEHTKRIALIDLAFSGWSATSLDETTVGNQSLRSLLSSFRAATIRPTRVGRRYANAAVELRDMFYPE